MATAVKVAYSSQQKSDENHFYQKFYSHFQNSASLLAFHPTHLFSVNCFDNYFEKHPIIERRPFYHPNTSPPPLTPCLVA
ncbi:MAG: hypothetical protein LBV59_13055 [Sphingobacterium sp.]|jgi:hypothetical protein|nr:hypothetical protein [Sphingobacterium sp.]